MGRSFDCPVIFDEQGAHALSGDSEVFADRFEGHALLAKFVSTSPPLPPNGIVFRSSGHSGNIA